MAKHHDISAAAAALGKRGGSVTSDRKAAASRENGKKGGKLPQYYCGMCDEWFTKGRECPKCGFDLERAARASSR